MKTYIAREPFKIVCGDRVTVYYYTTFAYPYFYCTQIAKHASGEEFTLRIFPENMNKKLLREFVESLPKFLLDLAAGGVREEVYDHNWVLLKLFADYKGGIDKLGIIDVVKFLRDP